jgi:hypothetical protein
VPPHPRASAAGHPMSRCRWMGRRARGVWDDRLYNPTEAPTGRNRSWSPLRGPRQTAVSFPRDIRGSTGHPTGGQDGPRSCRRRPRRPSSPTAPVDHGRDARQRVALDRHQIGEVPGGDGTQARLLTQEGGAMGPRRGKCVCWGSGPPPRTGAAPARSGWTSWTPRPRLLSRGRLEGVEDAAAGGGASMGPRLVSRGRPRPSTPPTSSRKRFNGATAGEPWKTQTLDTADFIKEAIQWGHGW